MQRLRGWEDSIRAKLACQWCRGVGEFRTSDALAACLKCNRCRECGRDRMDPCGDCLAWDEENRGETGHLVTHGVRQRRGHGE